MTSSRFSLSLDYLQSASRASLQSFELARLNHAAHLRREIAALIDQWIQETSDAMLARWMLDHHHSLQSSPMSPADVARSVVDPANSLLPDPETTAASAANRTDKPSKYIVSAKTPAASAVTVKAPPRSVRPATVPPTHPPSAINALQSPAPPMSSMRSPMRLTSRATERFTSAV